MGRVGVEVVLLALGLGVLARPALAQPQSSFSAPSGKPGPLIVKKREFKLPITMPDPAREAVKELQLYVKEPGGVWQKRVTLGPTAKEFQYYGDKDGEYWFSVVTVDKQGHATPADVMHSPPDVIVVLDTTPPMVEVTADAAPGGGLGLRCIIKDANPDYQKLQLSFQPVGQAPRKLEPVPGMVGMFRLPPGMALNGTARWQCEDKAQNINSQEVVFSEQANSTTMPGVASVAPPAPPGPLPNMQPPTGKLPTVSNPPQPPAAPPAVKPIQDVIPVSVESSQPANAPLHGTGTGNSYVDSGVKASNPPHSLGGMENSIMPPLAKPGLVSSTGSRQLINTQTASIDYRLDKVGPSGVSKVEVWVKGENAAAWQRLAVATDRKNPLEVQMPHEGLFGIRMVVTNGNGFGGNPPQPNDQPAYMIEVDTTPPFAQLHPVGPVTSGDIIDIRWTATDKNMGSEPVNLYYATKANGPWQPIARGLANTGSFGWHFPREIGGQFFVKLEVCDEAGNKAVCETPTPVMLDLYEPQAQVVGVSGVSKN